MEKISILLVDDHALFREALTRWLEGESDLAVAAHCASLEEAAELLARQSFDVLLLDQDLGAERGLDFLARALQLRPGMRVLMVTAGMTNEESVRALALGAAGIVIKNTSPALLAEAVRRVIAGETWVGQDAVRALVEAAKRALPPATAFSERERQVLQGVLDGLGNKEIGARLGVSEGAVKAALQQLFSKTGVRSRSQLVRIALESSPRG